MRNFILKITATVVTVPLQGVDNHMTFAANHVIDHRV